jgi:hypothetical protein
VRVPLGDTGRLRLTNGTRSGSTCSILTQEPVQFLDFQAGTFLQDMGTVMVVVRALMRAPGPLQPTPAMHPAR